MRYSEFFYIIIPKVFLLILPIDFLRGDNHHLGSTMVCFERVAAKT